MPLNPKKTISQLVEQLYHENPKRSIKQDVAISYSVKGEKKKNGK